MGLEMVPFRAALGSFHRSMTRLTCTQSVEGGIVTYARLTRFGGIVTATREGAVRVPPFAAAGAAAV